MVPNCLCNYIGIRCLVDNPKSGFFINDLEGLNLRYASDIADSDHRSGLEFLQSKIQFASEIVMHEITRYALPYFRINSIVSDLIAGEFKTGFIAPAPADRGLDIKIRESRLLRIRVRAIHIKIQQINFNHSIEITDGLNVYSYPFTTDTNGDASVYPGFLSNTENIKITMNDTAINVNDTDIKNGCGCSSKSSQYITASGWNGSGYANTSYGIRAELNAECSQDEIACILSSRLALPILYRAGMEIAKEAITSDRLNSITLLDSEKGQFLIETFSSEYDKHFKTLIESLPQIMKRLDDCCIICNQSRYIQAIP